MKKMVMAMAALSMTAPVAFSQPAQAHGYHGKMWRGSDGRMHCRRPNGTTGLIVGAAGGALLGRAIDTRGERATGTILGAAAGALVGREIDRSRVRCR